MEAPPPCTTCAVKVHYTCKVQTNTAGFTLVVENTKPVAIPYQNLTVRYWYKADAGTTQTADCDYAKLEPGPCPDITRTFQMVTPALTGATNYLEFGFNSTLGSLMGFSDTGDIQIRIHNTDYSTFDAAGGYSYDCSMADTSIENMKITAYVSGALVWGTEPM
jgi:endoglucanase